MSFEIGEGIFDRPTHAFSQERKRCLAFAGPLACSPVLDRGGVGPPIPGPRTRSGGSKPWMLNATAVRHSRRAERAMVALRALSAAEFL